MALSTLFPKIYPQAGRVPVIPTFAQNLLDEVWTWGLSSSASCTFAANPTLTGCTTTYSAAPLVVLFPEGY